MVKKVRTTCLIYTGDLGHHIYLSMKSETERSGCQVAMQKEIYDIENKVDMFLDRISEAKRTSLIDMYEDKIDKLEDKKALLKSKIEGNSRPIKDFESIYRTAFDFLANPCKIWSSGDPLDKRSVLKLAFSGPN